MNSWDIVAWVLVGATLALLAATASSSLLYVAPAGLTSIMALGAAALADRGR